MLLRVALYVCVSTEELVLKFTYHLVNIKTVKLVSPSS